MIDRLANPKEAIQRMGLPRTGSVTMKFSLNFSSAPEIARLNCWCQLHTVETLDFTPIKQGSGFWSTVGIFVIALGLS